MTRRGRIILVVAIVLESIVVYYGCFGPQTLMTRQAHSMGRRTPFLSNRPVPITENGVSSAQGTRLSYFGYSFEVPWEVDTSRSKAVGKLQAVYFKTGNAMIVANPPAGELLRGISGSAEGQRQNLSRLLGEDVIGSDFLLRQTIYNATPSDVTLFAGRKHDSKLFLLLMLKSFLATENDASIFSIHNSAFRGFQVGDPASRPMRIFLQFFSNDGELEITLVQKKEGSQPTISQADLNRIIMTVQKAEASPSSTTAQGMKYVLNHAESAAEDCALTAYPASRSTQEILADVPRSNGRQQNSNGLHGKVAVDSDGKITHLRILQLALPEAPKALRERVNAEAVESIKRSHYAPRIVARKPVASCADIYVIIDMR